MANYDALLDLWDDELGTADTDFTFKFYADDGTGKPGQEATTMAVIGPDSNLASGFNTAQSPTTESLTIDTNKTFTSNALDLANESFSTSIDIVWMELVYDPNQDGVGVTVGWAKESSAVTVADGQKIEVTAPAEFHYGDPGSDDVAPSFASQTTYTETLSGLLDVIRDETDSAATGGETVYDGMRVTVAIKTSGETASQTVGFPAGGLTANNSPTDYLSGLASLLNDFEFTQSSANDEIDYIKYELRRIDDGTFDPFFIHDYDEVAATAPSISTPGRVSLDSMQLTA